MCKHTNEPALDKCAITLHPKLELKYRILRLMGNKMTVADAVTAICEEAVKDVPLTDDDIAAIGAEMTVARKKRMANRVRISAYNRGHRT